jgi:hypothetical protein
MRDAFQLCLDEELVLNTPSSRDGVDRATEDKLRIYGCELIQKAGVLLRLYLIKITKLLEMLE